jgi:flagellar motility protein MotE (MotC chaperone)
MEELFRENENKKQKEKKLFIALAAAPVVIAIALFIFNGNTLNKKRFTYSKNKIRLDSANQEEAAQSDQLFFKLSANSEEVKGAGKNAPKVTEVSENSGEKVEKSADEELENKYLQMQNKLISEKLKRLEAVRNQLDSDLSGRIRSEEERTDKLVKVVEKMRPQAAAQFMENISSDLAISILEKLSDVKSSKIFNLMTKEKLARIGEKFVGIETEETADARTPASKDMTKPEK